VYDYNVGRFLGVDPFVHGTGSQGINPYSYIMNNPLAGTDPSAYSPECGNDDLACQWDQSIANVLEVPREQITAMYLQLSSNNGADQTQQKVADTTDSEASEIGSISNNESKDEDDGWGFWDTIQTGLDVIGMIPVVGEVADLANAGISVARGDYEGAALSMAAMVPFAGSTIGAAKLTQKLDKVLDQIDNASALKNARRAQLKTNKAAGKAAEAQAAKDLVAEGNIILGSQVSVRTTEGRRVIDHLIQQADGTIKVIEVKSGDAVRNASQLAKDKALSNQGGVIVGKNAPKLLKNKQ